MVVAILHMFLVCQTSEEGCVVRGGLCTQYSIQSLWQSYGPVALWCVRTA